MANFYVTFGQKYRQEPHPYFKKASPDGFVTIIANNYEQARDKIFELFDVSWGSIYDEEDFDSSWYPKGNLATFNMDTTQQEINNPS